MYRQILGYVPANVIPAFMSMATVYAYTRLMSPEAFGAYSLVFSAVLVLQASLFYALPTAVMRFYPGAVRQDRREGLLKEAYVVLYGLCVVAVVVCCVGALLFNVPAVYRPAALLGVPLLLMRSAVQLNQAVNRSANLMGRYNTIECLHAVLGFVLGLVALLAWHREADAIVAGLLLAATVCAAIDMPLLMSPFREGAGRLDRTELGRLIEYAWPMVAVAATGMVLQNSDRFLLASLSGPGIVGIFAVAYNLVDRPMSVVCSAISTATFPLAVQVLEQQGKHAARLQNGRNGIALLAVTLPACVGLALTSDNIAAVLIGPAFRPGVAALLPLMSFAALARGIRSHFIDHAFHLGGKPLFMLGTYGPATIVNIILNLILIPRFGMFGAAWSALICQTGSVIGGWFLGTSLFPVWLPVEQVARCVGAIMPMAAALFLIRFPMNWTGLVGAIALGAVVYAVFALLLDVGQMRSLGMAAYRARLPRGVPAYSDVPGPR